MLDTYAVGRCTEYLCISQEIHQLAISDTASPVLAGIYVTLMSKMYRARDAANADMSRWQESHEGHEATTAALRELGRSHLAQALWRHSENTTKEALSVVVSSLAEASRTI